MNKKTIIIPIVIFYSICAFLFITTKIRYTKYYDEEVLAMFKNLEIIKEEIR